MTRPSPAPGGGSPIRLLIGTVLIIAALSMMLVGFVRLVRVLEAGGHGTAAMRAALAVLGGAGALFTAGIATVIWDITKRYEHK